MLFSMFARARQLTSAVIDRRRVRRQPITGRCRLGARHNTREGIPSMWAESGHRRSKRLSDKTFDDLCWLDAKHNAEHLRSYLAY